MGSFFLVVFQLDSQDMVLLKFKSEQPPPIAVPTAELSQLIRTNLNYPESQTHAFITNRSHIFILCSITAFMESIFVMSLLNVCPCSLCVVPVTLTVTNGSLTPAEVLIELQNKSTG